MQITPGNGCSNYISEDHMQDVFYDCMENIDWPNEEFFDCIDMEILNDPLAVPLLGDISTVVLELFKIAIDYEAGRFTNRMLFNLGLGIPLTIFKTAMAVYRAMVGKDNVGTALLTGLPLMANAILPHADRLPSLADYLKKLLDKHLNHSLLEAWTADDNDNLDSYLWLGLLALTGHYLCQRLSPCQPQRGYLKLPPIMADMFTRACLYWQSITLDVPDHPPPRTDGFGRLTLNRLEKNRQMQARCLAKSWARQSGNHQQSMEQAAEAYYGISRINAGNLRRGVIQRTTTATGDETRHLPGGISGAIAAVRAITWTWCGSPSTALAMPSLSLLPLTGAAPADSAAGLRSPWPTLDQPPGTTVSAPLSHAGGGAAVGPPPGNTVSAPLATARHDPIPRAIRSAMQAIDQANRYLLSLFPAITPFSWSADADHTEPLKAYTQAQQRYWQRHLGDHCLVNILNIVTQLYAVKGDLPASVTAAMLHHLGLYADSTVSATLHLFDINGYSATDMMVLRFDDGTHVLYLPRGERHIQLFNGLPALRQWVIDRCAAAGGREEIALHFALDERTDGPTIFGKWGVDRWLSHLDEYSDRIFQHHEALSQPWYEVMVNRQRARAADDAEWLTRARLATLRQTGRLTAGDTLFNLPLAHVINPAPAGGHGLLNSQAAIDRSCASRSKHHAPGCALAVLGRIAQAIVPAAPVTGLPSPALTRQDVQTSLRAAQHELAYWRNMPVAGHDEQRVIDKLVVLPVAYDPVKPGALKPSGNHHEFFQVSLKQKDSQHRASVQLIRMHHAIVPLRLNQHHQFYEIFDINQPNKAGYPVYLSKQRFGEYWRFGYVAEAFSAGNERKDTPMSRYLFISSRLYRHIAENIKKLRCQVTHPGPINSKGLSHDADGHAFLKVGDDFIKISKPNGNMTYLIGSKGRYQFQAIFDSKLKKYLLYPVNKGRGASKTPPDGISAGLAALFDDGMATPSSPGLPALKQAVIDTQQMLRDLIELPAKHQQVMFYDTLYAALRIKDTSIKQRQKVIQLLDQKMREMLDLLPRCAEHDYKRLRFKPFKQADLILAVAADDPPGQLWINSRFTPTPTRPWGKFDTRFCRFSCPEAAAQSNIATVGLGGGRANAVILDGPQTDEGDFAVSIKRLLAGDLTPNEVDYLINLPLAGKVSNAYFSTDRKLAQKLIMQDPMAGFAMIMDHPDLLSALLTYLYQTLYPAKLAEWRNEPWNAIILFASAFQTRPIAMV